MINALAGSGIAEKSCEDTALDTKSINRIRTIKYLFDHGSASRQELAQALGFSMPTVFQIVNSLTERGLICESGEYGSTGGRRAKILTLCSDAFYVAGVGITKNHIQLILMGMSKNILDSSYLEVPYEDTTAYYKEFGRVVREFLEKNGISGEKKDRLLGVGISLPGTLDLDSGLIRRSLTLGISGVSLVKFAQEIPYPVCFGQNSKNAAFAEVEDKSKNVIYLSLNDTIGGGAYLDERIYIGDHFKAMLLGHIIIRPEGRRCYCGKQGCLNAYCSLQALCEDSGLPLEQFFERLKRKNGECEKIWDFYLENLSVGIANIRAVFDCDIILGGKISQYLGDYLYKLKEKVLKNSIYEYDASFVTLGKYRQEVFAVGVALVTLEKRIQEGGSLFG